jgi:hypothetical protein
MGGWLAVGAGAVQGLNEDLLLSYTLGAPSALQYRLDYPDEMKGLVLIMVPRGPRRAPRVLILKREMIPCTVIVGEVADEDVAQMCLVQNEGMVPALTSWRYRTLGRASRRTSRYAANRERPPVLEYARTPR